MLWGLIIFIILSLVLIAGSTYLYSTLPAPIPTPLVPQIIDQSSIKYNSSNMDGFFTLSGNTINQQSIVPSSLNAYLTINSQTYEAGPVNVLGCQAQNQNASQFVCSWEYPALKNAFQPGTTAAISIKINNTTTDFNITF